MSDVKAYRYWEVSETGEKDAATFYVTQGEDQAAEMAYYLDAKYRDREDAVHGEISREEAWSRFVCQHASMKGAKGCVFHLSPLADVLVFSKSHCFELEVIESNNATMDMLNEWAYNNHTISGEIPR